MDDMCPDKRGPSVEDDDEDDDDDGEDEEVPPAPVPAKPKEYHGHGHAYVDGAYSQAKRKYGYGVVLHYTGSEHGELEFFGSEADPVDSTLCSVAGEIAAVRAAVNKAIGLGLASITIYHDFDSLARWADFFTGGDSPKHNYSVFIERMREIIHIEFVKVNAHSRLMLNERADALAKMAICGE